MIEKKYKVTRRQFLEASGLTYLSLSLSSFQVESSEGLPVPEIGLCGFLENSTAAKQAGCAYIEEMVSKILMPSKPHSEFTSQLERFTNKQPLKLKAFNVFLPAELPVVGSDVNQENVIKYAAVVFERASIAGAKLLVLGSGGARRIPEGFDKSTAKEQFISICASLAPLAASNKITIAVEQLNRSETNFINTLHESAEIVEAVNHPNLKMMCDIYHAMRENDPPTEIKKYKRHLVHCHIAEKENRTPPGIRGDDFTPYFKTLKEIKYRGAISLECRWQNFEDELGNAVREMKRQYLKA